MRSPKPIAIVAIVNILALIWVGLFPPGVRADGGTHLASLIAAQTGITRSYSLTLQNVAAIRTAEIPTTFAHRELPELSAWHWGEVIAWNRGYTDPYAAAVTGWRNSPSHWNIMINPFYNQVGCDHRIVNDRHYFVCIFGFLPSAPQPGLPPPPVPRPPQVGPPIVDVLTDTAMEQPE